MNGEAEDHPPGGPEGSGGGRPVAGSDPEATSRSLLPQGLPSSPPCPFCETAETEIFSAFGSQLSVATYWCRRCRSPFEFMKWGREPGRKDPRG